jgi:acetolactate synthase-1/3 small subunit
MRHIISILLQNEAGALARVANLFSSRGYNIESLNVAPTADETVSRLTLVTSGSDSVIEQIGKQLGKLIDVVEIADMTSSDHIERELALFKLTVANGAAEKVQDAVRQFDARVLNDTQGHYTVELVGGSQDIDRFLKRVASITDVVTVVRSGAMAVTRGAPAHKRGS